MEDPLKHPLLSQIKITKYSDIDIIWYSPLVSLYCKLFEANKYVKINLY